MGEIKKKKQLTDCNAKTTIHVYDTSDKRGITMGREVSGESLAALRISCGMNRRQFAEYFGIPYRTLQDWELGNRHMPDYLLSLMQYKITKEKLNK